MSQRRYQICNPGDLIHHSLDSMALIFQKASGITHVVADPIPAIIEVMGLDALSVEQIASKLARQFDVEQTDGEVADVILARLEELRALGLAEQVQ